jgi:hypothetical protein
MTTDLLTDLGEEYFVKNGYDSLTVMVGLYNDATDALGEASDVSDITTEPTNTAYARQSVTFSAADLSGNWGVDNDSSFSFDFTDTVVQEDVNCAFIVYSFQAADTGDSSSQLHLLANPSLSQRREIGSIDTLDIQAGDLQIRLD